MSEEFSDYHWRNSMRAARFFGFDARTVVGIALVLVHIRLWTFMLAILVIAIFWLAERAGYDFNAVLRRVRTAVIGPKRPANVFLSSRRLKDYGK